MSYILKALILSSIMTFAYCLAYPLVVGGSVSLDLGAGFFVGFYAGSLTVLILDRRKK